MISLVLKHCSSQIPLYMPLYSVLDQWRKKKHFILFLVKDYVLLLIKMICIIYILTSVRKVKQTSWRFCPSYILICIFFISFTHTSHGVLPNSVNFYTVYINWMAVNYLLNAIMSQICLYLKYCSLLPITGWCHFTF